MWNRSAVPAAAPQVSTSDSQRFQTLLLAAVSVVFLAYLVRVRPLQAEMDEVLLSIESGSSSVSEPSVEPSHAAYLSSPQDALADFYARMEQMMQTAGISLESRQARIETDPRYPAATLIYASRSRTRWPDLLVFLSAIRQARPRIQINRLTVHRLDTSQARQMVEIFFEARALALEQQRVSP